MDPLSNNVKISIQDVTKIFYGKQKEEVVALKDLSLDVQDGEFLVIVGASGCGKTIIFITHSIDEALLLSSRIMVMTARPGRIAQEIVNDLPHPRNADVQLSSRYMELKRTIWDSVQAEVMKSMEVETD